MHHALNHADTYHQLAGNRLDALATRPQAPDGRLDVLTNRRPPERLALSARPPQPSVDTLDDHWYALRPSGQARYEECLALYERCDVD